MHTRVLAMTAALAACGRLDFAALSPDATAPDYCALVTPVPAFCSDFDGVDPWIDEMMNFATLQLDTANRSPPFSLEVVTEPIDSTQTAGGQEQSIALGPATRVTAAFDVRVDAFGQSDPVIAIIELEDASDQIHDVEYVYREPPRQAYVEDVAVPPVGSRTYTSFPFDGPTIGAWHRVTMTIDVGAGTLTTTSDGATQLDVVPAVLTSGEVTFFLGVPFLQGPSSAWQFHFDNVVIDLG